VTEKDQHVVLVLGGSGLLGVHCYYELHHQFRIITTYHNNPLPYENSVKFNVLDGTKSLETLLELYQPDVIINTIALVTVDGCEQDPELATQMNVSFVADLVDVMGRVGLQKSHLIQISSDSVYGQHKTGKDGPWTETDPINPLSVYARTKLQSEEEATRHNGPVSILRTAFYGINPFSKKSLLWWIIDNARNGREMDGWENIYFSPVSARKLIYVMQVMVEKSVKGIFNVGSVDACNKFDFVDAVCESIGCSTKINRVVSQVSEKQLIRPEYSVLCSDKLSTIMPWGIRWRDDLSQYLKNILPFPQD
jgi:dTDP-4-dehydrorhamnose reductase